MELGIKGFELLLRLHCHLGLQGLHLLLQVPYLLVFLQAQVHLLLQLGLLFTLLDVELTYQSPAAFQLHLELFLRRLGHILMVGYNILEYLV